MKILRISLFIIVLFTTPLHLVGSLRAPDSQSLFGDQSQKLAVDKKKENENKLIFRLDIEGTDGIDIPVSAARHSGLLAQIILEQSDIDLEKLIPYEKKLSQKMLNATALCLEIIEKFIYDYAYIAKWFALFIQLFNEDEACELKDMIHILDIKPLVSYYDFLEKGFKCSSPGCGYATKMKHKQKRSTEEVGRSESKRLFTKNYHCPYCTYESVYKNDLYVHFREEHKKERPFQCSSCDYAAARDWHLNHHLMLHSGKKPFKCPYPNCDYSGRQSNHLKSHLKTNHQVV